MPLPYPATVLRLGRRGQEADEDEATTRIQVDATPEERIESAYAVMQSALRTDLLRRILLNSPSFFESAIIDLLLTMGYGGSRRSAATQLGWTADGGVDGVISEDRVELERVYVQAKRHDPGRTVGRPSMAVFSLSLTAAFSMNGACSS
jgi:restriction system protein